MSTASLAIEKDFIHTRTVERKSLVIIGGGVAGLSAAIAWALNNDVREHPVVVLEKEPSVGGCVTSFVRKGFLFDTVQMIPDASDILEYLGVDIDLRRFAGCTMRILLAGSAGGEARTFTVPAGYDEFRRMLRERYPREAGRIDRFFSYTRAMYDELFRLRTEPNFLQLLRVPLSCPRVVKNRNRTFREYFDHFGFEDPELREIFDVFAAFSALPAERAAALMTVAAFCSTLEGVYRPKRGFIQFPQKMRLRLVELGGEVRTRTGVSKILVDKGRVWGVRLSDGGIIAAENIITTVDPKVAMMDMVGLDIIRKLNPGYADKVESMRMSTSSLHVSLGLDDRIDLAAGGLNCGYTVITTGGGTFERLFAAADRNEIALAEDCFHVAAISPSLITGGKPTLIIRAVPMPLGDWVSLRSTDPGTYVKKKEYWADFCIRLVEKHLVPNLGKHILVRDIATPATFSRYTGSPTGSIYDMAPYPDNFGRNRLRMRTPVKGLYQPKFSHGLLPALLGGMQAVDMILGGKVMEGMVRFKKKESGVRSRESE
ncbi:MAG: phytoene desaturase family protein [Candidatus Latescibacterota bacterium]